MLEKNGHDGKKNSGRFLRTFGILWALGIQFGITVIMSIVIGYYLDIHFDSSPLFLLSMTVIGFSGGFLTFYRLMKRFRNRDDTRKG